MGFKMDWGVNWRKIPRNTIYTWEKKHMYLGKTEFYLVTEIRYLGL